MEKIKDTKWVIILEHPSDRDKMKNARKMIKEQITGIFYESFTEKFASNK
jgi:hypothetical protein